MRMLINNIVADMFNGVDVIDVEYIIRYDIDEDEDEWIMLLFKDLKKGDLIVF